MKSLSLFAAALVLSVSSAHAAAPQTFTPQTFEELSRAGKPMVVHVFATWCPVCKAQKPVIESLSTQASYKDVTILNVDFDVDKASLKRFNVSSQSTLIAFKGGKEAGRTVGDASPAGIEGLFKKAI